MQGLYEKEVLLFEGNKKDLDYKKEGVKKIESYTIQRLLPLNSLKGSR
jgi:hypothetical protein